MIYLNKKQVEGLRQAAELIGEILSKNTAKQVVKKPVVQRASKRLDRESIESVAAKILHRRKRPVTSQEIASNRLAAGLLAIKQQHATGKTPPMDCLVSRICHVLSSSKYFEVVNIKGSNKAFRLKT